MIHYMNLHSEPFARIKDQSKTIELRLFDEKRKLITIGDTIVFKNSSNEEEIISAKVIALHKFQNFAALYKALPLDKCGYLPHEEALASPDDMNIYYSTEKQKQYGVVGIEIQVI